MDIASKQQILEKRKEMENLEIKNKKPEDVIAFLRKDFNFGTRDESAQKAVERCIHYIENEIPVDGRLLPNEPRFLTLLIEELRKAGFIAPKTIFLSREEINQALISVAQEFDNLPEEKKKEFEKTHIPWS